MPPCPGAATSSPLPPQSHLCFFSSSLPTPPGPCLPVFAPLHPTSITPALIPALAMGWIPMCETQSSAVRFHPTILPPSSTLPSHRVYDNTLGMHAGSENEHQVQPLQSLLSLLCVPPPSSPSLPPSPSLLPPPSISAAAGRRVSHFLCDVPAQKWAAT